MGSGMGSRGRGVLADTGGGQSRGSGDGVNTGHDEGECDGGAEWGAGKVALGNCRTGGSAKRQKRKGQEESQSGWQSPRFPFGQTIRLRADGDSRGCLTAEETEAQTERRRGSQARRPGLCFPPILSTVPRPAGLRPRCPGGGMCLCRAPRGHCLS